MNGQDIDGWTPLLWAAKGGRVANVERLLRAGATNKPSDLNGWDPCAVAMYHDNFLAADALRLPDQSFSGISGERQLILPLLHEKIKCDGCQLVSGVS